MKRIIAIFVCFVSLLGTVVTVSAVESQFGGYWRTRAVLRDNFSGTDDDTYYVSDTRTRLYYTAKFNDDFKFINKFEFNTVWGDANGGDAGTDGTGNFRIKASYVDFNLGNTNVRIGLQLDRVGRGFWWDNDFAGIRIMPKFGKIKIPIIYATLVDEDARDGSTSYVPAAPPAPAIPESFDRHLFIIKPNFKLGENVTLEPSFTLISESSSDTQLMWYALDASAKFGTLSAWTVLAYNNGTYQHHAGRGVPVAYSNDVSGYFGAFGVDAGIVHGQAFYCSGEDLKNQTALTDDSDGFVTFDGYHPWAEIMGWGTLDGAPFSNNSGGAPSLANEWAVNIGATLKPMPKLKLDFNVWYAELVEEREVIRGNGDWQNELGVEFDFKVTYNILKDLRAEYVFAYLVAGAATGEEDPIETGIRLSLRF